MSEEKLYKISIEPTYKKSITELTTFRKPVEGVENEWHYITMDQGWRWGRWVGEVSEEDLQELREESESDNPSIEPDCYEGLEMEYLDDGVWCYFETSSNTTEEMLEEFEEAWDDTGYEGIEDLGWEDWGTEVFVNCALNITVEGEDEEDGV